MSIFTKVVTGIFGKKSEKDEDKFGWISALDM